MISCLHNLHSPKFHHIYFVSGVEICKFVYFDKILNWFSSRKKMFRKPELKRIPSSHCTY
jgi:hypothetical protein